MATYLYLNCLAGCLDIKDEILGMIVIYYGGLYESCL